jgi:hypothetical protein
VQIAASATRIELTARPASARRTTYMAMVSGSAPSSSRPRLAHQVS